jgi:hypothetical protein
MDLKFIRNYEFIEKQANDYSKFLDEMAYEYGKKIIQEEGERRKMINIEDIISMLEERENVKDRIIKSFKNKQSIDKNDNFSMDLQVGDMVFWREITKNISYGKIETFFDDNQVSVTCNIMGVSYSVLIDSKSILFVIPKGYYASSYYTGYDSLENLICSFLKDYFNEKEKKEQKEEIKLYPFQEKIYNEIINCNLDSEHRKGRKYLFVEMPPRTGKTTLIKKLNEYFNDKFKMNLSYSTSFNCLDLYNNGNGEKSSVALIDDMQKTFTDTSEEIDRSVFCTMDYIKRYTTNNALIVFIGNRFQVNDYMDKMKAYLVTQVMDSNLVSLLVKKYPAWENSTSQCLPRLDYNTLKSIKEQMGEEKFSVMYLLKI